MGTTIWAPLAEIRMSDRTARRLSAATVERYRVWLEQGREAPPVRLARTGEGFAIRDGRHRVAAALAAGHTLIEAEVWAIARLVWRMLHPRETLAPPSPGTPDGRTPRLHRGRVGSTPAVSTSRLRSVNGKHAPFVRPRCGFDSCRRLLERP